MVADTTLAHYISLCVLYSKPQKQAHILHPEQQPCFEYQRICKRRWKRFNSQCFSFIVCGSVITENGHERVFKTQNHTIAALSLPSVINEEGISVSLLRMLVGSFCFSFSVTESPRMFSFFWLPAKTAVTRILVWHFRNSHGRIPRLKLAVLRALPPHNNWQIPCHVFWTLGWSNFIPLYNYWNPTALALGLRSQA